MFSDGARTGGRLDGIDLRSREAGRRDDEVRFLVDVCRRVGWVGTLWTGDCIAAVAAVGGAAAAAALACERRYCDARSGTTAVHEMQRGGAS